MADFDVTVDIKALMGRDGAAVDKPDTREPLWRSVLGERLRNIRHDRGETLGDTATRAGVSPQYLSEMERGLKEPSSEMIAAVAGALDITLGDLTLEIAESLAAVQPASSPQASLRQFHLALAA